MPPFFILLVAFVGFGLLLIVFIKLISALVRPRSTRRLIEPPPDLLITSPADDGFWISGDQVSPSSMIQYYYWIQGVKRMGEVPFQPGPDGRQFIYTGERPDSLSVALAGAAMSSDPPDPTPPVISTRSSSPRRSTSDESHFPRAY